jgi:aryl carrier-like protein
LLKGIRLVIFRKNAVLDIDGFISSLSRNKVSRIVLVPSLLKEILANKQAHLLKDLKYWTCSGEELPDALINNFYNLFGEHTLLNIYGSTEVTADATCYNLSRYYVKGSSLPKGCIGKPIYNTAVYILSDNLELLPPGITGELCVSGAGVSSGYLHLPDLTQAKFVDHPFVKGEKLYLTGDLARWLPDGNIAYMGRKDSQVKIRGYRIELKEIEQALLRKKEMLSQAVVTTRELSGEKVIIAYVVAKGSLDKAALKAELEKELPVYMLPSYVVELTHIPLTFSGKVDRKALPEVEEKDLVRTAYKGPQNSIEQLLVEIWQEVLGVVRIGISDNFYELGGNSLRSVHIVARLKQAQFHLDVIRILKTPTIEALAPFVTHLDAGAQVNIENELFELSGNQLAYFRDNKYRHAVGTFSLELFPFDSQQWLYVLQQACTEIEVLRMKIFSVDGILRQSPLAVSEIAPDVTFIAVDDLEDAEKLWKYVKQEHERPFDLRHGKGMRSCVCYKGEKAIAFVMIHHALTDDPSNRLLRNWLHARYHNGSTAALDTSEHRRFAALQRRFQQSDIAAAQLSYWVNSLLPLMNEHGLYQGNENTAVFECRILHEDYRNTLQYCRRNNITPGSFMLSLALLDQYFLHPGMSSFIVNTIVNMRENEQGIGQFSNMLPLGITIDRNSTLADVCRLVHQVHLDGRANGQTPYNSIRKAVGKDLHQYVFAAFNYRELPGSAMPPVNEVQRANARQEYPVEIRCDTYVDGIIIKIDMNNTAFYRNGTSAEMLTILLRTILKQPQLPLAAYYSTPNTALNEQASGSDH